MAKPLFQHQIEFNYLPVKLFLADGCRVEDGWAAIEVQQYRLLILDHTVPLTAVRQKLQAFRKGEAMFCIMPAGAQRSQCPGGDTGPPG